MLISIKRAQRGVWQADSFNVAEALETFLDLLGRGIVGGAISEDSIDFVFQSVLDELFGRRITRRLGALPRSGVQLCINLYAFSEHRPPPRRERVSSLTSVW